MTETPAARGGAPWDGIHDHRHCAAAALAKAEAVCARRGARLTALRRRVLEILWTGHRPRGAYDILEVLRAERGRAAPPTVYRALEFLLAHGLVHRIESRNAFVGCATPERAHGGQFLICARCGVAAELDDPAVVAAIRTSAARARFRIEHPTIELAGLCPACQERKPRGRRA